MNTRYLVAWRLADSDTVRNSRCVIIDGYSTVDDIPKMLAIKSGHRVEDVVIIAKMKVTS